MFVETRCELVGATKLLRALRLSCVSATLPSLEDPSVDRRCTLRSKLRVGDAVVGVASPAAAEGAPLPARKRGCDICTMPATFCKDSCGVCS